MIEKLNVDNGEANYETMSAEERITSLMKLLSNSALIEAGPSKEFIVEDSFMEPGGSLYYGTGLTTPNAISRGLPFDLLGMMLSAEQIRRSAGLERIYHHVADTHAKTNEWISHDEVDDIAKRTVETVETIKKGLGLTALEVVLSSSFDETAEYGAMVEGYDASEEHEYVRREMADMQWYKEKYDVRMKLGWIIQAKETDLGFDERRFDREFLKFHPRELSFIYTKPGRTFDPSRPKASPYITIENEDRLVLSPDTDVRQVFQQANNGDPNLGGAKKHIQSIVRLYEDIYGNLGKIEKGGLQLEDKVEAIINHCFGGK